MFPTKALNCTSQWERNKGKRKISVKRFTIFLSVAPGERRAMKKGGKSVQIGVINNNTFRLRRMLKMENQSEKDIINVMLIEDDPRWQETVEADIAQIHGFCLCVSAASIAEAKAQFSDSPERADIIIVDLMLPDGKGHDFIRYAAPQTEARLLVCSSLMDSENVISAIEAGACGYILKGDTAFSLQQIFELVLAGGAPISPSIAGLVLRKIQSQSAPPKKRIPQGSKQIKLTERETEILTLIARGYRTLEVAEMLVLTYNTVSSHIKNIYKKLQVNSRTEAIFEASQQGLIDQ